MDRKQVPLEEREAVTQALRVLLDDRDSAGKRVWSQASLGKRLGGLSQEAVRKAKDDPSGVGPAVRDGLLNLLGLTARELVESSRPRRPPEVARAGHKRGFTVEERRLEDARWDALRVLVDVDGLTPNEAHDLVFSVRPHGDSDRVRVYELARRELRARSVNVESHSSVPPDAQIVLDELADRASKPPGRASAKRNKS